MTTTIDNEHKTFNVPNLRFPEFEGEWEESTIGKQFELYSGNTPSRKNKEFFNGTINWISSGELKEHYIYSTKERISQGATNNLKLLSVGTFVIAIYGLEAEGVRGTGSITQEPSTISQACMAFTPKGEITNEFLYSWYKKHGDVIGVKYAQGTKQQNLSYDILEKFKISYPNAKEQDKLNLFFSLLDKRISTQNKIIEDLKKLKVCVRMLIFRTLNCSWFLLSELEASGDICLKRGNIIPKHEHTDIFCYPVYSSSVQNGGLMGYNNTYMFNTELVTWSIDGGGNFFYRHKHKFNVTNVSGYMQLNEAKYNYRFVSEILLWQHSFMVFDYQTKAHPSVIRSIYKLPDVSLAEQELIANIFRLLDVKLQNEMTILKQYQQQKQYLLCQMFI